MLSHCRYLVAEREGRLVLVDGGTSLPSMAPLRCMRLIRGGLLDVVLEDQSVVHLEELLLKTIGRIRDVREGSDGFIYVLNDDADAGLFCLEPR